MRLGFSSEIYPLETADIALLSDAVDTGIDTDKFSNEIIVLLGDVKTGVDDCLLKGRRLVNEALQDGVEKVNVKLAFEIRTPRFDVISTLIKKRRERYESFCSRIYHIDPHDIRRMNIERNFKTKETAYNNTKKRWYLPQEERDRKYNELLNSIKNNGYRDDCPIEIMLCRSFGVQDTVHQGHHRMGIAMDCNLSRISVKFKAAGYTPSFLHWLLKPLARQKLQSKLKK